jgi:hypothetical protein
MECVILEGDKEKLFMKKNTFARSLGKVALVALAFLLVTTAASAAWYFLKSTDVADKIGNHALSVAFKSETAVNINASATSGGYTFTLLAVVSGRDITDNPHFSDADVREDRTYAVVAIQNADGTSLDSYEGAILSAPVLDTGESAGLSKHNENGAITSLSPLFFASPLVKGLKPWEVNAATMNGGYSEIITDGILYRIVECDNVAMFADRGLYFGIASVAFFSNQTFLYDERTGEIAVNPDFEGASALFDLPLDKSLADPEKAARYLDALNAPDEKGSSDTPPRIDEGIDWNTAVPVAATAKTLEVAADGAITYSYDFEHGSGEIIAMFGDLFTDNHTEQSKIINVIKNGDSVYAIRFALDGNGNITGMIVMPE